ncbi:MULTISPECIES: aldo/keto reductase [Halobacillus]|uniref:aldo/keto reductase n=1 Tax=Halobacillus TaxID=45667 RepID=UPI00136E7F70|nr:MULTISPECIES: aldo/keto reductase [Halobacillus]MYL30682.1 aldo/keto reductase [Halobacillus halophilus]MYL38700.1 aldo/keto reductase [Halobacillus litoralis]
MGIRSNAVLSNGVEIPRVGLGVYKMEDGKEVQQAVQSAVDLGYRHIDTASFYENEAGVGEGIKACGVPREELFITTKVWNDEQGYDETLEAFDRSLDKLGVETLDLYLIHWPVPGKFKDTWKALEKLYHDGRVRAIGVCNFMEHHLDELMEDAEVTPMVNQVEFHPALYQEELADYCYQKGIQLEAWAPLARGRYFDAAILKQLAENYHKTPAQIILRWHLQHDIAAIPKSSNPERQKENFDVFDFDLKSDEMLRIDELHSGDRIGKHPDEFDYQM